MEHHPSSYWEQPFSQPYFDNTTKRETTTTVGQAAYLHCRVRNLGDRAVSPKFPYQEPVVVITAREFGNIAFHGRGLRLVNPLNVAIVVAFRDFADYPHVTGWNRVPFVETALYSRAYTFTLITLSFSRKWWLIQVTVSPEFIILSLFHCIIYGIFKIWSIPKNIHICCIFQDIANNRLMSFSIENRLYPFLSFFFKKAHQHAALRYFNLLDALTKWYKK